MRNTKINCLFGLILIFLFSFLSLRDVKAYSIERLEMAASSVTAMPGQEVKVDIDITKNPGICGLKFDVSYADFLTLKEITFNEAFEPYITAPQPYSKEQQVISFVSPYEECTEIGTIATLTFKVEDNVEANSFSDIFINYYNGDIFDEELKNIPVYTKDGKVSITTEPVNDSITLNEKNHILTAAINSANSIIEFGIICSSGQNEVDLNTSGRTRIVFDTLSNEKTFSLNIAGCEQKAYRAYFIIRTSSGEEIVKYSNTIVQ